MTATYTNDLKLGISVAVWLAHDEYDHDDTTISATKLMKPIKQLILSSRVPASGNASLPDISGNIASHMGTAIHNGIEKAWTYNAYQSLIKLGYPQAIAERVMVNPTKDELTKDKKIIPIYMERRSSKTIEGFTVSGKFDFVSEGKLEDFKSTGVYTYIHKTKDEDYRLQGSIYRWLNQDIITKPSMTIQYIFTDWKAFEYKQNPSNYPPSKMLGYPVKLMPIDETERYVRNKLIQIKDLSGKPESEMPSCTPKELWQKDPKWKYYKNPNKMTRSTKNFNNSLAAHNRLADDGHVGKVVEIPGEVVACKFCDAFPVCTQKDGYLADGTLKL